MQLDIALGRYTVKGSNNGSKSRTPFDRWIRLIGGTACYNMRPCIEFSAKNNIHPHITYYKIEELPKMIDIMVRPVYQMLKAGNTDFRDSTTEKHKEEWV